jgi:RNA polymerase sigma-70 factor (ECF subfamily)
MIGVGRETSAYNGVRPLSGGEPMRDPAPERAPQPSLSDETGSKQASEQQLIARIVAGERALFYELIQPYQRAVFLAANAIVQNEADAEDAAQEAIVKALANLASFRGESRFSTWLIQIAINEARMRLRKSRRHLYESTDDPGTEGDEGQYFPNDLADWREIPSEALERKELRAALKRAMASLKPRYREVFMLRDVQHLSISETAIALGLKEATVKIRLLRARLMMRDALSPGYDGNWQVSETGWKKVRPW